MVSKTLRRILPTLAMMSLIGACSQLQATSEIAPQANAAQETAQAADKGTESKATSATLSPEKNNAIAEEMFGTAWNKGDLSVVDKLIAADAYDHSPLASEKGSQGFKKIITSFRAAMPDLKMSIEDKVFSSDRVVHRWKVMGTHTKAPLFGVPASGKKIALTGITIVRMKDGKIAERWTQLDQMGLLMQLGIIPAPGSAPKAPK